MRFMAVTNVPGYLPEGEPGIFDTAREAWSHLHQERRWEEDYAPDDGTGEYSDTCDWLEYLASPDVEYGNRHDGRARQLDASGAGSVHGPSINPGEHDLGLCYTVTALPCPPWCSGEHPCTEEGGCESELRAFTCGDGYYPLAYRLVRPDTTEETVYELIFEDSSGRESHTRITPDEFSNLCAFMRPIKGDTE